MAEKENCKIAVEIKSFVGHSDIDDLEKALGQYVLYRDVLSKREPDRILYVAVHEKIYNDLFTEPIGQLLLENQRIQLIIFNPITEVILRWIP